MEDKNKNLGGMPPGDADAQASPFSGAVQGYPYDPQALSAVPAVSPSQPGVFAEDAAPAKKIPWRRVALYAGVALVLFAAAGVLVANSSKNKQEGVALGNAASQFDTTVLELDGLKAGQGLDIGNFKLITINGLLNAKDGLVISPSVQPATAQPGQIYYDINSNTLAYFNGTEFVSVGGDVVQQISGLTGQVSLGGGLSAGGGQLSNTGVLSVQGLAGNVAFTAGNGVSINGTTITNSGVVSVSSSSPSIVVSNDGSGNITLSGSGSGTVSSLGGTAGRLAKFNGVQEIGDSLIGESGTVVTVNGDLGVTGSVTLGSPLTVANGGTGAGTLGANGVLVGNGAAAITSVVAGASGLCLVSTAGTPNWASCTNAGNAVTSLNGLTGSLTIANATGLVNTITIDDASTSNKGIVQFNGTNFNVGSGIANTIQNIDTTASPTFSSLTLSGDATVNGGDLTSIGALNITPAGTLTAGSASQTLTLQGNSASVFTATSGANTTTLSFQAPTADVTYRFATAALGTYDVCTSVGNCSFSGGAPSDAEYLVMSLNGTLTNERAIASGNNISFTDGGANGTMTVATVQNPTFTTSVTTPTLQSSGALTISSAAGTTVAIDAGTTIELQDSTNITGSLDVSAALNAGTLNAFQVSSGGAITAATGITSSGTIIFSGLNCTTFANGGALTANGSGQLSCSDDDGGAGSAISGSGTTGTIPIFSGTQTIGDSIITQAATTITISGSLNLSNALTVANGGTGATTFATNGVLYGNGTSALQVTTAGTSGQVLVANALGVPTFVGFSGDVAVSNTGATTIQPNSVALGTDTTGDYISNLGALTGLSTSGNSGEGSTPTLSVTYGSIANTAVQGNVTLTCPSGTGNLTGGGTSITLGTGGTCANLNTVANPTFSTSVTTPSLILTGAGSNGTIQVGNLGQGTVYTLPDPGGASVAICIATGNCAAAGAAGGDLTGSYPNPTIAKLQGTNLLINSPVGGHILVYNATNSQWENHAVTGDISVSEAGVAAVQANSVALSTDTTGNYVIGLTAGTGVNVTGTAGEAWSPTVSVVYGSSAATAVEGNTSITVSAGTNLTGGGSITLGAGGTVTLNVASSPTFSGTLTVQGATATIGTTSQQGSVVLNDGSSNTGTLQTAALGQDTTYVLPDPGSASVNICLSTGNCAGSGTGVTTAGGTLNRVSKFTGSQAIADSSISDDGSTVTINGTANIVVQGGTGTFGTTSQAGTLAVSDGSSNTVSIVTSALAANRVYTLPDAGGAADFCLSSGNCVGGSGGAPNAAEYLVMSLNGTLSNERAVAAGSNISLTDGGANGNLTVATVQNPTFTTSVTTPILQSSGALTISSAAGTTVAIDAGTTIELQDSTNVTGSLDVSVALNVGTLNAFQVSSAGAISAATGIISSGTVTFSGLDCTTFLNGGALTTNVSGQLSCSDDAGPSATTITGTGTNGTLPVFTGAQTVADSIVTQSGTTINIAGTLTINNALTVANGGTGASTLTSRGVLYGNGTGAVQVTAAGTSGQVLVASATGVPTFVSFSGDVVVSDTGATTIQANSVALGTDTTGDYVANLGTLTGLSTSGNSGEGSTPTLSVTYGSGSNTAVQGNTSLTCPSGTGNLTGGGTSITLGTGGTCANLNTVANPTFATSVTTPSLIFTGAGSNGSLQVASLGQVTAYTLPDPGGPSATICLTTGNCTAVGSAGGDLTGSYPNPTIAKFQGGTLTISSVTSGNILQYNGTAWVNQSISGDITLTSGAVATIATGAVTSAKIADNTIANIDLASGAFTNITGVGTLTSGALGSGFTTVAVGQGGTGATSLTSNGVLYGNGTGAISATAAGANGQCLVGSTGSAPGWATCSGLVTLQNAYDNSTNPELTVDATRGALTVRDNATPIGANLLEVQSNNGLTTYFSVNTSGVSVTGTATASGNINSTGGAIQTNNTTRIDNSGNLTNIGTVSAGTYNGQTISATASLTGTLTVANNLNLTSGDIAVGGGDITSTGALNITPGGTLAVGSSTQTLTLQGGASTSLKATSGVNTTTVDFTTPSANTTLSFPALTAGNYNICTSSGNCLGAGVTLQATYNNSTNPELVLDATRGALTVRDNATPIGANLLEVQNNAASTTYFAVSSSGINTTGTNISSGNINSTGGAIQTNNTTRIDNSGNLQGIGNLTATGAITIASTGATNDVIVDGADQFIVQDAAVFNGTAAFNSLGTTNTSAYLCLNGSSQIAACNTTGAGAAFLQGGNTFSAAADLGTNDANALNLRTSGTTRLSVGATGGVTLASGNSLTLAGGNSNIVATSAATGTTGTTTGTGVETTTLTLTTDPFSVNDVVFVDNAGQDFYTRITADPGTGSYTISPAITFETGRTVTKYTVQNIGATTTDYTTQANRFFQGYFLGGVVTGSGSTIYGDQNITSTGRLEVDTVASSGVSGFKVSTVQNSSTGLQPSNFFGTTINPGGTASASYFGNQSIVDIGTAGTTFTGDIIANLGQINWSGASNSSNTGKLYGTVGKVVTSSGAGSIQNAVALFSQLQYAGGTTVTNSYNVYASNLQSGATTNLYGFYAENMTAGTNNYPLYLSSATANQPLLSVSGTGATTFQNSTNSSAALQVKTSQGVLGFNLDTATPNLITNHSLETDTSGWAAKAGSAISRVTTESFDNTASLQVAATAANHGATYTYALSSSTQYTLSMYVKRAPSGFFSTLDIGRSEDGATDTNCATGKSANSSNWTRIDCTFTTGTVSGTTYVYIRQSDATTRNWYVDAVQLETAASVTPYRNVKTSINGNLVINGGQTTASNTNTTLYVQSNSGGDGVMIRGNGDGNVLQSAFMVTSAGGTAVFNVNDTSLGATFQGGSAFFNTAALQVLSTNAGARALDVQGAASQTADILRVKDSSSNTLFSVGSAGAVTVTTMTNSTSALRVNNSSSTALFTVDTTSNNRVSIGTSDTTGALLVLDTKTDINDPTGVNGAMYYNSAYGRFRCYQNSAWVDCVSGGSREYLRAHMQTNQTTNIAANDHIKYDTVNASAGGSVTLDTTTTYTSAAGASVGRFTLAAGKTYKLSGSMQYAAWSTCCSVNATFRWYDVTNSNQFGSAGVIIPGTYDQTNGQNPNAEAIITPATTITVEMRLTGVAGTLSQIGNSGSFVYPNAFIEVLSDGGAGGASAAEYMRAENRTQQLNSASETDIDDHIKFANVQASSGSSVTLDTTSSYVEGGSGASVGRFTLAAGKTYMLRGDIPYVSFSADAGYASYAWYDVTSGSRIGSAGLSVPATYSVTKESDTSYAEGIITTSVTTLVELRLTDASSLTAIGYMTSPTFAYPSAFIEVLSDGTKIAQFTGATAGTAGTSGFIPGAAAGQQGSVLLGDGTWSTGVTFLSGAATFQNVSNSTTAFQVLNASAVSQFTIDTSNSRAYVGNPTADGTGALLVLDTKNTSGDPTGVLGAMYFNSNSGKARCFETDQGAVGYWRDCVASARSSYRYTNDMMTTQADQVVLLYASNSGSFANVTGVAGHPGINELRTNALTNGAAGIGSNDPGAAYLLGNGDYWRFESTINIPTLSDGTNTFTIRSGFSDNGAADAIDGCYFRYSSALNAGKWQGVCRSNSTESTCDTGITVAAATWYRLTFAVNTAGNSVDFQTSGTSRCQVTTNIPTAAGRETSWNIAIQKSAGTTSRTAQLDYVEVYDQFGSSR